MNEKNLSKVSDPNRVEIVGTPDSLRDADPSVPAATTFFPFPIPEGKSLGGDVQAVAVTKAGAVGERHMLRPACTADPVDRSDILGLVNYPPDTVPYVFFADLAKELGVSEDDFERLTPVRRDRVRHFRYAAWKQMVVDAIRRFGWDIEFWIVNTDDGYSSLIYFVRPAREAEQIRLELKSLT